MTAAAVLVAFGHTPYLRNTLFTANPAAECYISFTARGLLAIGLDFGVLELYPQWGGYQTDPGFDIGAPYEIRCTLFSGDASDVVGGSAHDVWLSLATQRRWGYAAGTPKSGNFVVDIRNAASTQVLTTGVFNINP